MRPEHWLYTIPLRLRSLFHLAQADQELDDELREHLERKTEEYVAKGIAPEEALRRARLDLGGFEQTKEKCRDARRVNWIEDFVQDLQLGLRMLRKSPGFTAVTILTLGLGIGANTAIFSIVNAVLLQPLPYYQPDQLVMLQSVSGDGQENHSSYPDVADWRLQSHALEQMATFRPRRFDLAGLGDPETVPGGIVSGSFFSILRVEPQIGRLFAAADDHPDAGLKVVLSDALWRQRFSGDPALIGQSLNLDGRLYAVIGVLPEEFHFPMIAPEPRLWTTVNTESEGMRAGRGVHAVRVIARLKQHATKAVAQAEMEIIATRLAEKYSADNSGLKVRIAGLHEEHVKKVRSVLWVLLASVGLLLLIACANVATLFLARAVDRNREMAVRTALGASHNRLTRQGVTESLLLCVVGCLLGVALAVWVTKGLWVFYADALPPFTNVRIDGVVLGFTLLTSVVMACLLGVIPVSLIQRANPNEALLEGGRSTSGIASRHFERLLVGSEVGLAFTLLIGAGLLFQSFSRLVSVDPGFDPKNILVVSVSLPRTRYLDSQRRATFVEEALSRLRSSPGVEVAAWATTSPFSDTDISSSFGIQGRPDPARGQEPRAQFCSVSPGYFQALGIPLLQGRDFTQHDQKGGPGAVIVSRSLAERYWPSGDALGHQITLSVSADEDEPAEWRIVGVVGDVRQFELGVPPQPTLYLPYRQQAINWGQFMVRMRSNHPVSTSSIAREIAAVERTQPVSQIQPLESVIGRSVAQPRFSSLLLALFAMAGLSLSALGIYGVLSYWVRARTREIGIHMAIGARPGGVFRLVISQGLRMVVPGLAVGLVIAIWAARSLHGLLFGVTAYDPLTYFFAAVLALLISMFACCLPAVRATRVDPMVALRYE